MRMQIAVLGDLGNRYQPLLIYLNGLTACQWACDGQNDQRYLVNALLL